MQEKDFISYEYTTKTVKAKDQSKAIDMYEAFGYEITSVTPSTLNGITISLKRDRKQKHKTELKKLERQSEELFETINNLHAQKTRGASIFAYIFGIVSTLIFGGGMSLTMLEGRGIPALIGGIALGILGLTLSFDNYLIYKSAAAKKTKQILPIIDDNEEKLANLLEKGNSLLSTDLI